MGGCRSQLGSSDPKPAAPELRWCLVSMLWPGFLVLAARPAANPPEQKDKHRRKPKGTRSPRGPGNLPMWQWVWPVVQPMGATSLRGSRGLLSHPACLAVALSALCQPQHHHRFLARSPWIGDQVGPSWQRDATTTMIPTVALCSAPLQSCFCSRVLHLSFKPAPPKMGF